LPFEGLLACERSGAEALLTLRAVPRPDLESAAARIHCAVETLPLAFEEIYRLVVEEERRKPGATP
jgi:hypothetical protein